MSLAMSVAPPADETLEAAPHRRLQAGGQLREESLSSGDRNLAIWLHLAPLIGFAVIGPLAAIVPLIMWAVGKDRSAFIDDHGREVINFGLTFLIGFFLLGWTLIVPLVLMIVGLISLIRGAVAASNGDYFRYPITIRFLS